LENHVDGASRQASEKAQLAINEKMGMKKQQQLLSKDLLTQDQLDAVTRMYEYDHTLMVAKMGGGKTITTLTAIAELIEAGELERVLVIAPLKVCKTVWAQELLKWEHTRHLTVSICVGKEVWRRAALNENAQITVINFENLPWLFKTMQARCWWDGLVVDEISKLKNTGGTQFRALRPRLNDYKWRVGLTGTPVSEDWLGLFGQMLVVDGGKSLGTQKANYMNEYFYATDFQQYNWELKTGSAERIAKAIAGNVYVMPDYRDQLPPIRYETVELDMPDEVNSKYVEMAESMVLELHGSGEAEAPNAAVLVSKLQQIACGFVYDIAGEPLPISDYRINAAVDLILANPKTLVVYWYDFDFFRLKKALEAKNAPFVAIADGDAESVVNQWNTDAGVRALLLHPRSAGHGLNLAAGGCDILWFTPYWSRDLWEQTNARLWRRGQRHAVTVKTLAARGSIDSVIIDRVDKKAGFDSALHGHLARIKNPAD